MTFTPPSTVQPQVAQASQTRSDLERSALQVSSAYATAPSAPGRRDPGLEAAKSFAVLLALGVAGLAVALGGSPRTPDQVPLDLQPVDLAQDASQFLEKEANDLAQQVRHGVLEPDEVPTRLQQSAVDWARTNATRLWAQAALEEADRVQEEIQEPIVKVWVSRGDPKVRELHRKLHGEFRPLTRPFYSWPGGPAIRYPGDPQAPLSQTANCRCALWLSRQSQARALRPALSQAFEL